MTNGGRNEGQDLEVQEKRNKNGIRRSGVRERRARTRARGTR